jgi:hypothetical protein
VSEVKKLLCDLQIWWCLFIFVNIVAWKMYLSWTEWVLNLESWNSYAVWKLCEVADLNFKFLWCKIQKCGLLVASLSLKLHGPCHTHTHTGTVTVRSTAGQIFFTVHACMWLLSTPAVTFQARGSYWNKLKTAVFWGFYSSEMKDVTLSLGEQFAIFVQYVEQHTH